MGYNTQHKEKIPNTLKKTNGCCTGHFTREKEMIYLHLYIYNQKKDEQHHYRNVNTK